MRKEGYKLTREKTVFEVKSDFQEFLASEGGLQVPIVRIHGYMVVLYITAEL